MQSKAMQAVPTDAVRGEVRVPAPGAIGCRSGRGGVGPPPEESNCRQDGPAEAQPRPLLPSGALQWRGRAGVGAGSCSGPVARPTAATTIGHSCTSTCSLQHTQPLTCNAIIEKDSRMEAAVETYPAVQTDALRIDSAQVTVSVPLSSSGKLPVRYLPIIADTALASPICERRVGKAKAAVAAAG